MQAVLTRAAEEFIRPLTFASLTGAKSSRICFRPPARKPLCPARSNISAWRRNDLLLVAPATANILAKFAHGLADDFLSTLYLAFRGPVVLAPAMNNNMWEHEATRANIETLRRRGHTIVDPDERLSGLRHVSARGGWRRAEDRGSGRARGAARRCAIWKARRF